MATLFTASSFTTLLVAVALVASAAAVDLSSFTRTTALWDADQAGGSRLLGSMNYLTIDVDGDGDNVRASFRA